jgi:hypothetical protein
MSRAVCLALAAAAVCLPLMTAGASSGPPSANADAPPPVPGVGGGTYLGAWVNPGGLQATDCPSSQRFPGCQEFMQLPDFEDQVGRHMAILHAYSGWSEPAPLQSLRLISGRFRAYPLLDWSCGDSDARIAAGADDQQIFDYAKALESYGKPVFLRWFWEMNISTTAHAKCLSANEPSDYIDAWQRVWKIFHGHIASPSACVSQSPANADQSCTVDAENVAFVWCPDVSKGNYAAFYPNSGYVDWIAADRYSKGEEGAGSFDDLFSGFYSWAQEQDPGAPMMIAETGSGNAAADPTTKGETQAAYLQSALSTISDSRPALEAFVYFDAPGPDGSWDLTGAGIDEFAQLGTHFTFGTG